MNPRAAFALTWLPFGAVALLMALHPTAASFLDGHFIPVGNDSFYHARRILDMMAEPGSLHQFDPKVHVPEGSMLIWPWGYDYLMSLLTRAGMALTGAQDPMSVLARLPACGFPLAILLTAIICRQLRLGLGYTLVALLGMLFLPLNLSLYAAGNIDHHFAEQLFVLGTLAAGIGWLAHPQSRACAVLVAALLGIAPCVHNGLFVLQLPLLAALGLQWLRGERAPVTAGPFALTLVACTLVAALPSASLRAGSFQFYTLSWFHVYFATCVAATSCFLAWFDLQRRNLVLLAVAALAMLVPVTSQLLLADRFMSVNVIGAQDISEVQSLWQLMQSRGVRAVTNLYSLFAVLLPATLILCAVQAWRERDAPRRYFWLASLAGLIMLASMVRMHVFGSFALLLPWLTWLHERMGARRLQPAAARGLLAVAGLAAVASAIPAWGFSSTAGNDPYYALTWDLYPPLAELCRREPGVALSTPDDANYVRYHTDCAVIANNFLLTPQHEAKILEVRKLMDLSPAELLSAAPQVRYLLVHRMSLFMLKPDGRMQFLPRGSPEKPDPPLVRALIDVPSSALPPGFTLVKELSFEKPEHVPYARLFAVRGPGAP